ncbi:hypothetical protein AB0C29_11150 [Actinoplanes sp. NPDC048791]|uniref:hypothetical protein n=1 Tax=Actinoplanes sp. NPDC048791 TaxID=3154623 RepID=UPI0033EC305C
MPLRAGERFLDLKMAEAYTPAPPAGGGSDGTQVMPENVAVAHHAIVYAVQPDKAALVREQDVKTPGPGWQCFGGTGVKGAELIWVAETTLSSSSRAALPLWSCPQTES